VLPEEIGGELDAFRLPLSAIGDAELIVVLGDDPVVERAPIVELWLRKARRNGAEIVEIGPTGDVQAAPGTTAQACRDLRTSELGGRLRAVERGIVIWSGGGAGGGSHLAALAGELGFADKAGSGAFYLPETANGRGVAQAWAAASEAEAPPEESSIGLLIVSGDEAAANPNVRALAETAERVIAITMFHSLAAGWADLVLPGTSYLEREGTYVNLEGRIQRLRRATIPPGPDELAWLAELAGRFEVEVSPYPSLVFAELSERTFGGVAYDDLGEQAPLPPRTPFAAEPEARDEPVPRAASGGGLQLLRYRPLFSGPAVERTDELQFQRPPREIELSAEDAQRLGVERGQPVDVRSNGTSVELRARVNRRLRAGTARVAEEHAGELHPTVEVTPR
jgi:predicted molibdopterin-dependent oxidoreductase YjgC